MGRIILAQIKRLSTCLRDEGVEVPLERLPLVLGHLGHVLQAQDRLLHYMKTNVSTVIPA